MIILKGYITLILILLFLLHAKLISAVVYEQFNHPMIFIVDLAL